MILLLKMAVRNTQGCSNLGGSQWPLVHPNKNQACFRFGSALRNDLILTRWSRFCPYIFAWTPGLNWVVRIAWPVYPPSLITGRRNADFQKDSPLLLRWSTPLSHGTLHLLLKEQNQALMLFMERSAVLWEHRDDERREAAMSFEVFPDWLSGNLQMFLRVHTDSCCDMHAQGPRSPDLDFMASRVEK